MLDLTVKMSLRGKDAASELFRRMSSLRDVEFHPQRSEALQIIA